MRACLGLILALALAGCAATPAAPAVVTMPVLVDAPVAVRAPLPAELVQPCRVVEPDPACWRGDAREYCNGQLIAIRDDYRAALRACDARVARLRALDAEARKP